MANKTNRSRNVMLIKNDVIYKRREDLEDDISSTIWIEVRVPKSKPVLISSIYRQWSLPKCLGVPNSNSIPNQTECWNMVLNKCKKANNKKGKLLS